MKNKFIVGFGAIVSIALAIVSCKKYPDTVGPTYYSAKPDFAVTNNSFGIKSAVAGSTEQIDFTEASGHFFEAEFNQKVDWTLKITGKTSGAYKIIKGSSSKIDASNTNWRGGHSGTFFFRKGETCQAVLSFLGSDYVISDEFVMNKVFNFNRFEDGIILVNSCDFEVGAVGTATNKFPKQFAFIEASNIKGVNKIYDFEGAGSVEGSKCYYLANTPNSTGKEQCDATNYFGGAIQHRYFGANSQTGRPNFLTSWTNPDEIWVNVYIYGNEETMASQVSFQLHEADSTNEVSKPITYDPKGNKNDPAWCKARVCETYSDATLIGRTTANKHDPPSDDSWEINIKPDTKGWKLYSIPLSSISAAVGSNAGNKGNKIKEPSRIARVQLGLVAVKPSQFTSMIVDYATVTKGGPFNPDKY